jgi:hypothetical protein
MQARRLGSDMRRVARSPWLDVVLAALLAAYAGLDAWRTSDFPQPHSASAALAVVSGSFLASRRIWPLASFAGSLGALAAIYVTLGHFEAGSSVLMWPRTR